MKRPKDYKKFLESLNNSNHHTFMNIYKRSWKYCESFLHDDNSHGRCFTNHSYFIYDDCNRILKNGQYLICPFLQKEVLRNDT